MGKLWIWIVLIAIFGSMWFYLNRDRGGWGPESDYCKSIPKEEEKDPENMTRGDVFKGRYNVGDKLFHFLRGCE